MEWLICTDDYQTDTVMRPAGLTVPDHRFLRRHVRTIPAHGIGR